MKRLLTALIILLTAVPALSADIAHTPLAPAPVQGSDRFPVGRPSLGQADGKGTAETRSVQQLTDYMRQNNVMETIVPLGTCDGSATIDASTGTQFTATLNGACEIGVTNLTAGQGFTLYLTQSATTAPTFTSAYKWALGTAPTWSATATKYDTVSCASPDGVKLICGAVIDAR